jgi:hypothetical protein
MTEKEYRARIDAMIEAEYEAIGGDDFRAKFGDKMVEKIVTAALAKRTKALVENDEEFKQAFFYDLAGKDILQWTDARRPAGAYREDGILQLSEKELVFMRSATREHLVVWALHESDERNLTYIRSRLDLWDRHPECKTLAELEVIK